MTKKFRFARSIVWFILCTHGACGDEVHRDSHDPADAAPRPAFADLALLDHSHWTEYPLAEDPFPTHQPASVDCGPAGWYVESAFEAPVLEIDTNYCNYALLEHVAEIDVAEADQITLELRHFDLRAPEPTQAHVALAFRDTLEWETFIAIPSDASVQVFEWRARNALAQGDPIRLHLHNHGQNTWIVASLRARVAVHSGRALPVDR